MVKTVCYSLQCYTVAGVQEVSMHKMRQYASNSIVCGPTHSHRGYTCMCKIKFVQNICLYMESHMTLHDVDEGPLS